MDEVVQQIIDAMRRGALDSAGIERMLRKANKGLSSRAYTKRKIMPYILAAKNENADLWTRWGLSDKEERELMALLQVKPRRTASGVATITVITKPHPCSSNCLYCPNDLRMPKSYLANEPACQRAERAYFDPYLQVSARVRALQEMGHPTDKIELIVLGGTWSDYSPAYQRWFIAGLFAALNDADQPGGADKAPSEGKVSPAGKRAPAGDVGGAANNAVEATSKISDSSVLLASRKGTDGRSLPESDGAEAEVSTALDASAASIRLGANAAQRRAWYEAAGFSIAEEELAARVAPLQQQVNAGALTYNEAFHQLVAVSPQADPSPQQQATMEELAALQHANETAAHRVVGLVIETRPDLITPANLTLLRQLGCTKVQMGVQSLKQRILDMNRRAIDLATIQRAFELLRLFGFKSHTHMMLNLYGATPQMDKEDFDRFVTDPAFCPDEIKLYPCALIGGTGLCAKYQQGLWQPYDADTLVDVLAADVLATPPYTRISRMIRDFSSHDIVAGNKVPNLRQIVEQRTAQQAAATGTTLQEIRQREINDATPDREQLTLDVQSYATTVTQEHFLQWVTPQGKIAGFLRLSLPHSSAVEALGDQAPVRPSQAMIREVHVYGRTAHIGQTGTAAQHLGLGKQLIARACAMAAQAGYRSINVISAVGTREYYRHLGFTDAGLYLNKPLP